MRIAIDLQPLQTQSADRRIGRYSLALTRAMLRQGRQHDFVVILNQAFPDSVVTIQASLADLLPRQSFKLFRTPAPAYGISFNHQRRNQSSELIREYLVEQIQPDVLHISSLFEKLDESVLSVKRFSTIPTAVTLYDLIPYLERKKYLNIPVTRAHYFRKLEDLKRADQILTISEFTGREAVRHLGLSPDRVTVISTDADSIFQKTALTAREIEALKKRYSISHRPVVCPGVYEIRKNIERLIEAYASLPAEVRQQHQLVLCGNLGPEGHQLRTLASGYGLSRDELVLTGDISDRDLVALYNLAHLVIFPACYEGSGLPVLEAMRCGAPVIGGNVSSIPEIIGRPEALFDPSSVNSMAEKLRPALVDEQFREQLVENSARRSQLFSWDRSALLALQALEKIGPSQSVNPGTKTREFSPEQKPALACLIAEAGDEDPNLLYFQQAILPALAGYYNISLVRLTPGSGRPTDSTVKVITEEEFKRTYPDFKGVLYVCDQNGFGLSWLSLFRHFPGLLVITGPLEYGTKQAAPLDPGRSEVERDLYHILGFTALLEWQEKGRISSSRLFPSAPELISSAPGVIVFNQAQGQTLANLNSGQEWTSAVFVSSESTPGEAALKFRELIENLAGLHPGTLKRRLISAITALSPDNPPPDPEIIELAESISENTRHGGRPRLLVDVSVIARHDARSGIHRVVRGVLRQLLLNPPPGLRVEPVYRAQGHYRYARSFTLSFLQLPNPGLEDAPVEVDERDIFLGLDLVLDMEEEDWVWLRHHAARGMQVYFVVYDILPLTLPECFMDQNQRIFRHWLEQAARQADGLIGISRATINEAQHWLSLNPNTRRKPLKYGYFHLGSDIESSRPSLGLTDEDKQVIEVLDKRPAFLMVGTLEPRKGYEQVIGAFEELWRGGTDVSLIIVGKPGWKMKSLVHRIQRQPELGRRLFWLEKASDEMLEKLYTGASSLLSASLGEGFGLPLIEAARHRLPVIVRDLAVFHEVAGERAFYFQAAAPAELAQALQNWLTLYREGRHPRSEGMPALTWEESTSQLLEVILADDR